MKLGLLVIAFVSFSAFGHDTFIGNLKGSGAVCTLEVGQVYYEGNVETVEGLRADVILNLDDGHGHKSINSGEQFPFTVKVSANPLIYTGLGVNGKDQVNLITSNGQLNGLTMYAVRWLHGSHFHSAQCLNLKYVAH